MRGTMQQMLGILPAQSRRGRFTEIEPHRVHEIASSGGAYKGVLVVCRDGMWEVRGSKERSTEAITTRRYGGTSRTAPHLFDTRDTL